MNYKIELKMKFGNDDNDRIPSMELMKERFDKFSEGKQGVLIYHESFKDYSYDISGIGYDQVDKLGVIGTIQTTEIIDDTFYLNAELNKEINLDENHICFFRAHMKTSMDSTNTAFDMVDVFAVDLIRILDNEPINKVNLSKIEKCN